MLLAACSLPDIPLPAPADTGLIDPPCVVIPRSPSPLGYQSAAPDSTEFQPGAFNPANADEIAVLGFAPYPSKGTAIYRLNLRSHQRSLVYHQTTGSNVVWSRTGWLAFLWGGEAWKVKANGDSAMQFTSTSRSLTAVEDWSPDGRFVLCQRHSADYAQTGLAIYTAGGTFVRLLPDAVTRSYESVSWSPDGRRLAYAGAPSSPVTAPQLCLYDLTTNQLDTLNALPPGYVGLSGVRWLPGGGEVVWGAVSGIGITNVQTRRTRLIRANCVATTIGGIPSRSVYHPAPSPDGQRILVGRSDRTLSATNSNLLLEYHSLETMSVQGGQIRRITP